LDFSATHSMYFVAVLCPQELNKKVLQYKVWMKEQFGCTVAMKSPAHITLVPPFWLENESESKLLEHFHAFTSDMQEIQIQINGFGHFSKKVLYVNVEKNLALEELELQADTHFIAAFNKAIRKEDKEFHPHVTIATRDMSPSAFFKAWEQVSVQNLTFSFVTDTITLLKLSPGKWNVIAERNWVVKNED